MLSGIAAEKLRERIPSAYLRDFEGITNSELASMAEDGTLPQDWRTYSGWELEFREALKIEVFYNPERDTIERGAWR